MVIQEPQSFRQLTGLSDRRLSRLAASILIAGLGLIVLLSIAMFSQTTASAMEWIENIQFTVAFIVASAIAWLGTKDSKAKSKDTRSYLAWALTFLALGQVLWLVLLSLNWKSYPGPVEIFFQASAFACAIALMKAIKVQVSPQKYRAAIFDAVSLTLVSLMFIVPVVGKESQNSSFLSVLLGTSLLAAIVLVVYLGIVTALYIGSRGVRGRAFTFVTNTLFGGLILATYPHSVDGTMPRGNLIYPALCVIAVFAGLSVGWWNVDVCEVRRTSKWADKAISFIPYGVALLAVIGELLSMIETSISPNSVIAIQLFGAVALLLALFRQGLVINDEQRLRLEQEALLRDRADLAKTLEAAQIGMWTWNVSTGLATWDKRAQHLIGANAGTTEGSARTYLRHLHHDDVAIVRNAAEKCIKSLQPYSVEVRVKGVDGKWRWVLSSGHGHRNELDGTIELRGFVTDITERKRAEEALRQSEAITSTLIQGLPGHAMLLDSNLRILTANQLMVSSLGFNSSDELLGEPVFELLPRDVAELRKAKIQEAIDIKKPVYFEDVKEGSVFANHLNPIVDEYGEIAQIAVLSLDITKTKEAEAELKDRELQLQLIGENLHNGMMFRVIRDEGGQTRFLYVSDGIKNIYGLDPEEVLNDYTALRDLIDPDYLDEISSLVEESERNLTPYTAEVPTKRRDGVTKWVLMKAFPRRINENQTIWEGVSLDITEHKVASQKLLEQSRQYEDVVNSIDGIVWESTITDFRFTFVSKKAESILGFPVENWFERPSFWTEQLHPDDRDRVKAFCYEHMMAGIDHDIEYRLIAADGGHVWVRDIVTVISENGVPTHARGIMVDITDRKLAEEAIRLGEDRYRSLIDTAPDAIVVYDIESGRFIDFNPGALNLFKASAEELFAKGPVDFSPPLQEDGTPSKVKAAEYVAKALSGETITFEWVHRDALGNDIYCEVKLSNLPSSRGNQVRGSITNITERRAAVAALRSSEERLNQIVEASLDAVVAIDRNGFVTEWNKEAERMFGYSREEALGQYMAGLILPPELVEAHERGLAKYLSTGESTILGRRVEVEAIRRDGSRFPVELAVASLGDGHDQLFSAFVRDLTELKKSTEEHQRLEAQLQQSQKLEAVGTLAAGIAHDFNNLLGAIRGNVELIRQDLPPDHPAHLSVEELQKSGLRATQLVEQILAFTRDRQVPTDVIDIAPIVSEAINVLKKSAPKNLTWVEEIDASGVTVKADPTQILQVVLNLGQNAIHAVKGRQGEVSVKLSVVHYQRDSLEFPADLEFGTYLQLTIADNGVGISEEILDRVFEPFFTTKKTGEGTGLGLAVVHGIAQNHNAIVDVQSRHGSGTTFRVFFKVTDDAPRSDMPRNGVPEVEGRGRHILYVDDDESLVLLVKRLLKKSGFEVTGINDPEAAIRLFDENPFAFDCIVTDFNMPAISGLDVIHAVRAIRPDVPIAMTSGYISEDLRNKITDLSGIDLIYKPNTVDQLAVVIEQSLNNRQVPTSGA